MYHGSLSGIIDDLVEWPVLPFVGISRQLASGLTEMHRYGIIHCDIKKNNVLYEVEENGQLHAVITDFGVSQLSLEHEKVQTRINVRIKAMSLAYADPTTLQMWRMTVREDAKIETEVNLTESRSKYSKSGT